MAIRLYRVHVVHDNVTAQGPTRASGHDYYVRASNPKAAEEIAKEYQRRMTGKDTWEAGKGGTRTWVDAAPQRVQIIQRRGGTVSVQDRVR